MECSFSSTSALGPQLLSSTPGHRPLCPEASSLQAGTSSGNLMHKPSPKGAWFMAPEFQQEAWGQGRESWTGRPSSESRGCSVSLLWTDGSGWTPYAQCHPPPIIPP